MGFFGWGFGFLRIPGFLKVVVSAVRVSACRA